MSETVRTIIAALNREPFNKNYTPMTFDALSPEDLLQVLTDVLAEMDEDHRIEIRKEEPEETIVRFLTMLRVLRYSPGPDPVSFRQGLVQGEKEVVYPILEWLLNNLDELKTRAYLGKYLVKVDVPLEVLSNPEISALYKQHLQLLEEFKTLHKTMLEQKAQVANVEEMRFDIEVMQEEKDMLIKKTERLQRKLENIENKDEIMAAVEKLWVEKDRKKALARQKEEEIMVLQALQQRQASLTAELQSLNKLNQEKRQREKSPKQLIRQLEEQLEMAQYITEEKLPAEIEDLKSEIEVLSRVISSPPYTQEMIDSLHSQIKEAERALQADSDPDEWEDNGGVYTTEEEGLELFRRQAAIVAKKKEQLANEYTQAQLELDSVKQMIGMKEQENMIAPEDFNKMSEDELKELKKTVKIRSTVCKRMKAEMASAMGEMRILERTVEILKATLEEAEAANMGRSPPRSRHEGDDENLPRDAILGQLERIDTDIEERKRRLSPVLKELKKTRDEYNTRLEQFNEKKQIYKTTAAKLEGEVIKLENMVKEMVREKESNESEIAMYEAKSHILETLIERAGDHEHFRNLLSQKIAESETTNEKLKEKNREDKGAEARMVHQRDLWNKLLGLFECKEECMERQRAKDGIVTRDDIAETLVLQ